MKIHQDVIHFPFPKEVLPKILTALYLYGTLIPLELDKRAFRDAWNDGIFSYKPGDESPAVKENMFVLLYCRNGRNVGDLIFATTRETGDFIHHGKLLDVVITTIWGVKERQYLDVKYAEKEKKKKGTKR